MKVNIETAVLRDGLKHYRKVTTRKFKPILGCVLIRADMENQTVSLAMNNCETSLVQSFAANVSRSGETCINAESLFKHLKNNKSEFIDLELTETGLEIVSKTGKLSLPAMLVDEFPLPCEEKILAEFAIDGQELKTAISDVIFCVSPGQQRYALGTVALRMIDGRLTFCATDGSQASLSKVPTVKMSDGGELPENILLNHEFCKFLVAIVAKQKNLLIKFSFSENQVWVEIENWYSKNIVKLSSRLVEGRFPKIMEVVNPGLAKDNLPIKFETQSLLLELNSILSILDKKNDVKGTDWEFENGDLWLESKVNDSQMKACIPVGIDSEISLKTAFNGFLVKQFLQSVAEKSIELRFTYDKNMLIHEFGNRIYLLMAISRD